MMHYKPRLVIETGVKEIFTETLELVRSHILPLSLIWAVFYIPTNVFILLRSGDMIRHLGSGSPWVVPAMLLLSLLGTVPNIAIVLLVARGECDDYNTLVGEAFRKLPLYVTTTILMLLRMLPLMFLGMILATMISLGMESMGMAAELQMVLLIPLILVISFLAFIRYYSSVNFYLVKGVANMKATVLSTVLFACNRKKVLAAFGVCSFLPMAVNLLMLYFLENEAVHVALGYVLGYYMFIASALYAGLFNHIREEQPRETLTHDSLPQDDMESTVKSDQIGDDRS